MLEDAGSGLQAVSDDQPVLYMGRASEAVFLANYFFSEICVIIPRITPLLEVCDGM
jgi:hypothetical protein